jgi:uncharacterized integral membrane protein
MTSQLSSDQISRLTPIIGSIARLICKFGKVTDDQLDLLIDADEYPNLTEVLDELHRWVRLLEKVHENRSTEIRETVIESLRQRGIAEAPAILAVSQVADAAIEKSTETEETGRLSVSTTNIDFGVLPIGKTAVYDLEVSGGPGQVIVDNPCIEVNPLQFGSEQTSLQISIRPQTEGDGVFHDRVMIKTGTGEMLEISITVQWQKPKKPVEEEIIEADTKLNSGQASSNVSARTTTVRRSIVVKKKWLVIFGGIVVLLIVMIVIINGNVAQTVTITPNIVGHKGVQILSISETSPYKQVIATQSLPNTTLQTMINQKTQSASPNQTISMKYPTTVAYGDVNSPDMFVRSYFSYINNQDYEMAWSMLSPHFKEIYNSTGYKPFIEWWGNIDEVKIISIDIVDQSSSQAVLDVELSYYYNNGQVDTYDLLEFGLVIDSQTGNWLFSTQKLLSGQK